MAAFGIDSVKKLVDPQWKKHVDRYKRFGMSEEEIKKDVEAYKNKLINTYKTMCPEIEEYINSLKY